MLLPNNKKESFNTIMILILILIFIIYYIANYFKYIENFKQYGVVACPPQFEKVGDTENIYYNSGNIGIGIADPKNKLDVNGTIKGTHLKITGPEILQGSNQSALYVEDFVNLNTNLFTDTNYSKTGGITFPNSGSGNSSEGFLSNSTSNNTIATSKYCLFGGDNTRSIKTKNISSILDICIKIKIVWIQGNSYNGGEHPDPNEDLKLHFLDVNSNLIQAITISFGSHSTSYPNNQFSTSEYVPTQLQRTAAYVQLIQSDSGNGTFDVYGVKYISFETFLVSSSQIYLNNLPTTLPYEPDRVWKDANGFLKVS